MGRLKKVSQRYADALSQVAWDEFERVLAQWYVGQGWRVEHVGTGASGGASDGGIDLKLYRGDDYRVVQCKRWNAYQVTHNAVHELLGVMLTEQATGAIVVTSGEFTAAAQAAAAREPRVQLIDGAALRRMLGADRVLPEPGKDAPGPGEGGPRSAATAGRRSRRGRHPLPAMLLAIVAGLVTLYVVRQIVAGVGARQQARYATRALPAVPRPAPPPHAARSMRVRAAAPPPPAPAAEVYRQTPMTDTELRDWKRRNAEAMKILEKTTPELP